MGCRAAYKVSYYNRIPRVGRHEWRRMARCARNRGATRQIGRAAAPGPLSVCGPGGPQRMAKKHSGNRGRRAPKTVLRLPDLDQAKSAVLNNLSSIDAQRGYRHAIDEFIEWYCSEPRLPFSRSVVLPYR